MQPATTRDAAGAWRSLFVAAPMANAALCGRPVVQVTIGRVDVRVAPPAHPPPLPSAPARAATGLTLEEYFAAEIAHECTTAVASVTATLVPHRQRGNHRYPRRYGGRGKTRRHGNDRPPGVNMFFFQVTPNAALRNDDLPLRRSDGTLSTRPRAAVDLHYLFTFYGDESTYEPERLLGCVVSALHARPALARADLPTTETAAPFTTFSPASRSRRSSIWSTSPRPS